MFPDHYCGPDTEVCPTGRCESGDSRQMDPQVSKLVDLAFQTGHMKSENYRLADDLVGYKTRAVEAEKRVAALEESVVYNRQRVGELLIERDNLATKLKRLTSKKAPKKAVTKNTTKKAKK